MPEDLNIEIEKREKSVSKKELLNALKQVQWNKTKAAKLLNIGRATLYRLLEKYNIDTKKE